MVNVKNPFVDAVETVLQQAGYTRVASPVTLLAQWEQFVTWCEDGYQWDVSEYNNELQVREKLETILSAGRLRTYPEIDVLKTEVSKIDERFRTLLNRDAVLESRANWWEKGILKRAGRAYASYFRDAYDIGVEVAE